MNSKDKLMLVFSIAFLLFVILMFIQATRVDERRDLPTVNVAPVERQSASFVLGEDKELNNPFYTNAKDYFLYDPKAKTDEVFTQCRSLACVTRELEVMYARNNRAFDTINIVVHSNPWSGISLPIVNGGRRITAKTLGEAYENNIIKALPNEAIDQNTNIVVYACGLGENRELVNSLSVALGGEDGARPRVSASNRYVNFTKSRDRVFKSDMEVFYAYYKTAYKPADLHLAKQLKKRYPKVKLDWLAAIQNEEVSDNDMPFSYRYNVPVEWEIEYPEYDMPSLETELDKMEWLMNQDELMDIIERTQIPLQYFRWKVKQGKKIDEEDYIETPYIKVSGKVTILCILKKAEDKEKILNRA